MLALQVGLLEELFFRGYLVRFALWALRGVRFRPLASTVAVLFSAVVFGGIHLPRPPTGGKDVEAIAGIGVVYGCIRIWTASTPTTALAHSAYIAIVIIAMSLPDSHRFDIG